MTTGITWSDALDGVDWNELSAMYLAAMGTKRPEDLRRTFGNSMFRCFVRDAGKLVGAGRALADGVDCSYVCDVAVLPSHQGTGIGKEIVQRLVDASRGHRKIILYAVPGKESFYAKFGFRRMKTAMGIWGDVEDGVRRGYIEGD